MFLFPCEETAYTQLRDGCVVIMLVRHTTPNIFSFPFPKYEHIHKRLPVVPAPVYAIKHLLVDNSHNFIKESFPEDSKYWNSKLYKLFFSFSNRYYLEI